MLPFKGSGREKGAFTCVCWYTRPANPTLSVNPVTLFKAVAKWTLTSSACLLSSLPSHSKCHF